MRAARTRGSCKLADGRVLMAGGQRQRRGVPRSYDPRFNAVVARRSDRPSRATSRPMTLLPNGKVLIAGGWRDDGSTSATAELFDPGTGSGHRPGP